MSIDYHVQIEGHYYSVPYQLVKLEVEARISAHVVEILYAGKRVASHRRGTKPHGYTTVNEHMPRPHREHAEWTPQRLVQWAHKSGPANAELVERIVGARRHPQQGFCSCLGILRLGKSYGEACARSLSPGQTHRRIDYAGEDGRSNCGMLL